LNFGNPEKPEIMAQLSQAIDGIAEACNALGTPVTGGNVSLYNETKGEGIYPTPVLGVVGIIDDVTKAVPSGFQAAGHAIVVLTSNINRSKPYTDEEHLRSFGSSEYAKTVLSQTWGRPPSLNLQDEALLHRALAELASKGLIHSASDVSDGGFLVALAKASLANSVGADIDLGGFETVWPAHILYNETESCVIVTTSDPDAVEKLADEKYSIEVINWGTTSGDSFLVHAADQTLISIPISDLRISYSTALESQLAAEVVTA
jgi:phosphoribosylformylglycinamidine (FGAM) synthase-like enzyme